MFLCSPPLQKATDGLDTGRQGKSFGSSSSGKEGSQGSWEADICVEDCLLGEMMFGLEFADEAQHCSVAKEFCAHKVSILGAQRDFWPIPNLGVGNSTAASPGPHQCLASCLNLRITFDTT